MTAIATNPLEVRDPGHRGTLKVLLRALLLVAPFRWRIVGKILLSMLAVAPGVFLPWPFKILIDHVLLGIPIDQPPNPYPGWLEAALLPLADATPLQILGAIVAVQLVLMIVIGGFGTAAAQRDIAGGSLAEGMDDATKSENAANFGFSWSSGLLGLFDFRYAIRLTQDINHHIRTIAFGHIQRLPMTTFDDERIGDAVYRVLYDTPQITGLVYRTLIGPFSGLVTISLSAGVMFTVFQATPEVAWAALSLLPIVLLVTLPQSGMVRRKGLASRRAGSETTTTMEEGFSNILAVQSLGGEGRESARFERDSWGSFRAYRGALAAKMFALGSGILASILLLCWIFFRVTDAVIAGQLSPGDMSLVLSYAFQIGIATFMIGALWVELQGDAPGLLRVLALGDLPSEADPPEAAALGPIQRGFRLEDVHYDYPDGTPALRGVDLEVPIGQVTALCGPAGAGKTTLASLLPRFVSPKAGVVRADGVDLETVTRDSLRSQIAFVFQETALFDESVAANLRLADPEAADERLREAVETAAAAEFIDRMPEGYGTRLGRGGSKLSVGQKQRLSIARALVRPARLLILDEPTSALDPETERRLLGSLRDASRERGVLVIAHRLSTIRGADRIAFLDEGRVVEVGSHAELMTRPDGAYRRFVELQAHGHSEA